MVFQTKITTVATMKKEEKVVIALNAMDELFKDYPLTELEYETPFQLLLSVLLSAQTTDVQVNKVTKSFYQKVRCPDDILPLGEPWVKEYIKTVGLHVSKTKNVVITANMLHEKTAEKIQEGWVFDGVEGESIRDRVMQYANSQQLFEERWYYIPDTIEWMTALAGVGIKTAKVVLYILFGQRLVAVDTHVHRVMNRLWIVRSKSPEITSRRLEKTIPDHLKDVAHRVIIYFGRYLCTARSPQCERCPLTKLCPYYTKLQRWHKASN